VFRKRLCFALCVTAALVTPNAPAGAQPGRPLVLLIHGGGQLERDSANVAAEWQRDLISGLASVSGGRLLQRTDIEFVWYADVLDPRSSHGCTNHEANTRSQAMWHDEALVQSVWTGAREGLAALFGVVPVEGHAISRIFSSDVAVYLTDLRRRCGAEQRLAHALRQAATNSRPVVLVAYSLGSLIAYNYLTIRDSAAVPVSVRVPRLVTFGSMIGLPAVFEALLGRQVVPPLPMPERVTSWVNVRDGLDLLAFPLRPLMRVSPGRSLVEVLTSGTGNIDSAHDAGTYLRDKMTARAIASGWCTAFGLPTLAPAACQSVVDVP
jgi:pimeloyl-ACP methyl ester carboxylesterase